MEIPQGNGPFLGSSSPPKITQLLLRGTLQKVNNGITALLLHRTAILPTGRCQIDDVVDISETKRYEATVTIKRGRRCGIITGTEGNGH